MLHVDVWQDSENASGVHASSEVEAYLELYKTITGIRKCSSDWHLSACHKTFPFVSSLRSTYFLFNKKKKTWEKILVF